MKKKKPIDTVTEIRKQAASLRKLAELEELVTVLPRNGGVYFTEWEKQFIASVRKSHDDAIGFTPSQRAKIKEVWHSVDLRRRERPTATAENLFSKMSPKKQAEQREKAAKIKLPWEK